MICWENLEFAHGYNRAVAGVKSNPFLYSPAASAGFEKATKDGATDKITAGTAEEMIKSIVKGVS